MVTWIMSTWLVTISAILQFLAKARSAKEQLDKANAEMSRAAQDLCSKWQGDAAQAFAAEQGVLYNHCSQLSNVGSEYMDTLQKVADLYERTEQTVTNAIKG
ncbi:MAG: hypothetical protein E7319_05770 [Clostridiales bacterium]|nr:hypothetical protein [Clostridiales bacterium]